VDLYVKLFLGDILETRDRSLYLTLKTNMFLILLSNSSYQ